MRISKNCIWIRIEPSFGEGRPLQDGFCYLVLFSGRGDRVGPWDGVSMLGKHCVASLWGPWTWPRREEGEKEVFFFAHLHRVPRNAGTGNARRFSAVSWMPERQIWKVARESRKVERSRRRSLGFSVSCGTALVSARGLGIGRLCGSFRTGATWYNGPREVSKCLPCPSECCPPTGGHCLLPAAAF